MDLETLKNITYLARIGVEEKEEESFLADFNRVLEYVDIVKSLDTSSVTEDEVYFNHENFTRPDKVVNDLTREDLASIAPEYENGYLVVPRVIET